MPYSYRESEVSCYLQKHGVHLIFQTLSSVLLTHRPEKPWQFISACIDDAIKAEAMPKKGKRQDSSFCELLDAAAPSPPEEHMDGRPMTPLESRTDNLQLYLERHEVKRVLQTALEGLIVADLPSDPKNALREYFADLAAGGSAAN